MFPGSVGVREACWALMFFAILLAVAIPVYLGAECVASLRACYQRLTGAHHPSQTPLAVGMNPEYRVWR